MSYVKQNFVDGNVLTAAELNHIEDGIAAVEVDAAATKKEIDTLKKSKAEIDDTAIDGDTWSSKHIVDMLCPKIEKSGTVVQMDGMLGGYPLGVTASWKPTQDGGGDPSPENIRPIQGRTKVKVERFGENVLEMLERLNNQADIGVEMEIDTKKRVTFNGITTRKANYNIANCRLHWVPGETYTLYVKKISGNASIGSGDGITFAFSLFTNDYTSYFRGDTTGSNLDEYVATQTALNETDLILMMQIWRENTKFDHYKFEIGIVKGTTPSAYTQYIGQTTTLTLPSTVYGGEVDAEGKGQETWGCIDSYAGETLPAEWICDRAAYAAGTTPPNGAQVAYKLDNPKPFTATGGAAIPALSGTNTVLTDADSMTVISKADPIQTVSKLSERIAALETAAIPAHN